MIMGIIILGSAGMIIKNAEKKGLVVGGGPRLEVPQGVARGNQVVLYC